MRVPYICVFLSIAINANTAKGQFIDEYQDYPVFKLIKSLPQGISQGTIFKQPHIEPSPEEAERAYECAILPCEEEEIDDVLCACNLNNGNVVTFKNACDMKKHNCRFYTDFQGILGEICPWEFQTRRGNTKLVIDYNNPKYYN